MVFASEVKGGRRFGWEEKLGLAKCGGAEGGRGVASRKNGAEA